MVLNRPGIFFVMTEVIQADCVPGPSYMI